jgi:hypothetical protein
MSNKINSILNILARKPKTQLNSIRMQMAHDSNSKRGIHLTMNSNRERFAQTFPLEMNSYSGYFDLKNSLLLLWNNKESNYFDKTNEKQIKFVEKKSKHDKNLLIIDDPFINQFFSPISKEINEKPIEKFKEKPKDKSKQTIRSIQECLIMTLFPEFEISINKENFIKEFRKFIALRGNEIFPDYKFISKIIKKLEYGEELMQSKTSFKLEWLSVISLLFYLNVIYFKDYQNYTNFLTYLPIDKNKRTLIIEENSNLTEINFKGEIIDSIDELLEKINPNYTKEELEKMKLDEIQKYSKFMGKTIYKEGKVGYINKTKEELINDI